MTIEIISLKVSKLLVAMCIKLAGQPGLSGESEREGKRERVRRRKVNERECVYVSESGKRERVCVCKKESVLERERKSK